MAQVQIKPLHPSLGAEIAGVDLGKPIDDTTRQALVRALADHLALVFHDQSLTPELAPGSSSPAARAGAGRRRWGW